MQPSALATEDPTPDLLDRKPHGRNEPLISGKMWKQLITQVGSGARALLLISILQRVLAGYCRFCLI